MKLPSATAAVVLDTRREKADGSYPLKLRITYQRLRKYYSIGMDLTEATWKDVEDKAKTRRDLREIRERITDFEKRAEKVIKGMEVFSFDGFESLYFRSETEDARQAALRNDLAHAFTTHIKSLDAEGRRATAESYGNALSSLTSYRKRLKLPDITVDFLKGYEKYMILEGRSATTIGIYLRALRAIINQAIDQGVLTPKQYPFGKNRYQIPGGRNIKKALTLTEVERLFHYPALPGSPEDKARDFWVFSYLCNGINLKDICRLKWKDIDGDRIVFIRAKTARSTKGKQKAVVAILTDPAKEIIEKWGNTEKRPESYVFPILSPGITPKRERELIQYMNKYLNKYMKRIASSLGIEKPVTTYYARHSFATVMKRSGAPIEFISESLGHNDLKTTDNYLDSFEDDVKREYTKALLNFGKKEK
ncbi:site-specific integrase [Larkinella soli]|uniref:site-specific integrase n=1 Tax=Larkinella soli TaxID=1770527 RepID=UPI000FFBA5B6|nr:site-specific integrase [Larkinella soli]